LQTLSVKEKLNPFTLAVAVISEQVPGAGGQLPFISI
jgi:hypothetical protein